MSEQLAAEVERLRAENAELLDLLADAVAQGCSGDDGVLDSGALSSYADALRKLAEVGKVEIVSEAGRRVIARWKEPSP